jgi:6,7-dimethyl-8-ribityllumazine synthase
MDLTILYNLAIGNGIITVENDDQAWARAKPDQQDKGGAAAKACIAMVKLKRGWGLD